MADLANENLISLREAARRMPSSRAGKRLNISTIWRWVSCGTRGVKLESLMVGGQRYTSEQAIQRFIAACNTRPGEPTQTRTPGQRQRDHQKACAELDRAGIR